MFDKYTTDKLLPFPNSSSELSSAREGLTTEKISRTGYMRNQTGTGTTPTAVDLATLKLAQTNAEEGAYFLICKKGKEPRPGVICDEEMVINFFKRDRPDNAKRPDGSYHKHFLPHGKCAVQKTYPFMYLDNLKL